MVEGLAQEFERVLMVDQILDEKYLSSHPVY